ncbi:DDHD-domain-containing protein [Patellaria atrata CBS 101060]|uniref:DDHD-domain-containing protein n=1 Tax=Patellaria atrata CBS 101060 TaxID=1346257 RepID=A0A9P4S5U5_9PEZI|nr:DDHD-domain-containing protein [Patellaria atrata CBS 101060]
MSTPDKQSYLSAGINAITPWGSRSATPQPGQKKDGDERPSNPRLASQRGGDHTVSGRPRLSLKNYPRDCPPLNVQWYHAVDIPKRKPFQTNLKTEALPPAPKKYVPFSIRDSRAIEAAFQKIAEDEDTAETRRARGDSSEDSSDSTGRENSGKSKRTLKVPVNEDFLFDVDVTERELSPAYWQGHVYHVRRGTWFYHEGSTLRPCDENLANQLEEGYLKTKAWTVPSSQHKRSASQPRSRPTSALFGNDTTPTTGSELSKGSQIDTSTKTHRLFGAHMNSVVTYQDAATAWLLTDDFLSRMSSTMYQRFAGGGHFAGVKLMRGYVDFSKKTDGKDGKRPPTPTSASKTEIGGDKTDKSKNPNSINPSEATTSNSQEETTRAGSASPVSETPRQTLERHMSSLVASSSREDLERQEEEVRQRDEQEIQEDYKDDDGEDQARDIEHLLLVTHGIGQRLGLRMDSVNFIHDVNTLRKTLKGVYTASGDLQDLNQEVDKLPKNSRIQVLPICWRHLLDFPKQSLRHNRKEHDLGDAEINDEEYPSLENITVEGVPAVRNLITDLALDVLLYQSPVYKAHISQVVLKECNRIHDLFKQRNPSFKGKVSLVGHSLGSAIMFDILCKQKSDQFNSRNRRNRRSGDHSKGHSLKLNFDVEDFYALGSPIGLFQMLKGRTIAARPSSGGSGSIPETPDDPFDNPFNDPDNQTSPDNFEITVSSPKCAQIFNIFHPTDPISYRLEPLISPAMSALKPQPLPYTKKGIFGAPVGAGLTGIGARVGQSVSGLWTSFSSGIASSLLNRSLGISAEDASKLGNTARAPLSGAGVPSALPMQNEMAIVNGEGKEGEQHPPTLIDNGLETLYAGFQKRRLSATSDGMEQGIGDAGMGGQEAEEKARRLRREEEKVRRLNGNGRVDYSIQEGAFDISLIASIASHLSYWADEDVAHFMISQLLARQRVVRKGNVKIR